jgi:membrane-associated HD superfamily phosphohydrolase
MFPYFYLTASKEIAASFQNNALISLLLMLILLVYILLYIRYSTLLKKGNLKKYLLELGIFSIVILFCTLIIEIYGIYSRIPPFIPIANETQFSSLLIEHFKIIPSVPLSWIVMLYTFVISLALIELFFSSKYVENINKKLEELRSLKYRIDRYQLGISPELNFENILKTLSKQKIYPPSYFIAGGIISIPIPLSFSRCEETFYSALEDQTIGDMENSQK